MANVTDIQASPFKADFPLLANNPELVFLDSAATAQRPAAVLDAERSFYETMNANPLRGLYKLSVDATAAIEQARAKVAAFVGADDPAEVIFTRNASESLNLIAKTLGPTVLHEGDEVCISIMEHHSNLIPWQQVCRASGAKLVFLRPDDQGVISPEEIAAKIGPKTKIVSVTHVSNVLGVENPIRAIADAGHAQGAIVIADGAQSLPHVLVDVKELGVDAFAFSAHKLGGPMGIGGLWAHRELLESLPPFLTGGEMIESVTRDGAVFAELPHKFEAGTVNAADAVGLHAAIDYVKSIGFTAMHQQEVALTRRAMDAIGEMPHVHVLGSEKPEEHCGIITFTVDGVHPHDISEILASDGVAIRAGHHCAQPLLAYLKHPSTARASLAFYNTESEVDRLLDSISTLRERMGYGK